MALVQGLRSSRRLAFHHDTRSSRRLALRHAVRASSSLSLDPSTLTLLRSPDMEVYLCGTAHISAASERAVREIIQAVRPAVVVVELCEERAAALRARGRGGGAPSSFSFGGGKTYDNPVAAQLAAFAQRIAFSSGNDMLAAMEEAEAVQARLLCGDLAQAHTMASLQRAAGSLFAGGPVAAMAVLSRAPPPPPGLEALASSLSGKLSSIFAGAGGAGGLMSLMKSGGGFGGFGGVSGGGGFVGGGGGKGGRVDEAELDAVLNEVVEHFKGRQNLRELRGWLEAAGPELIAALVHDRDAHLFAQLDRLATAVGSATLPRVSGSSCSNGSGGGGGDGDEKDGAVAAGGGGALRAVAVVGAGHMDGIEARWAGKFGGASVQPIIMPQA